MPADAFPSVEARVYPTFVCTAVCFHETSENLLLLGFMPLSPSAEIGSPAQLL